MSILTKWIRAKATQEIETPTMKIDDFPEMFSEKIIGVILQEEKNNKSTYIGGDFHINYIDESRYSCSYELYFKDNAENPYKIAAESKPISNAKLFPESIKELAAEKTITFEIPEPSPDERKNFSGLNITNIFDLILMGKNDVFM